MQSEYGYTYAHKRIHMVSAVIFTNKRSEQVAFDIFVQSFGYSTN